MDIHAPNLLAMLATAILVATLTAQTWKQWREHTTRGMARWLFLGQVSASLGFLAYGLITHSAVLAFASAMVLASALAGFVVLQVNRRRALRRIMPPPALRAISVHRQAESASHLRVAVLG